MTVNLGGRPSGHRPLSAQERRQWYSAGATLDEIAIIFRMDRRTIQKRIIDVESCGRRGKMDLFQIADVAPHLVKPVGDFAEYIRKANPRDLPQLLTKEFWNGVRARQAAMLNEGALWHTPRVLELLSRTFKTLRTRLLLIPDELERKTSLSDPQRVEIKLQIDNALEQMRDDLLSEFGGEPTPDERPGTLSRADLAEGEGEAHHADGQSRYDDDEDVGERDGDDGDDGPGDEDEWGGL